jgi:hypothetical protein
MMHTGRACSCGLSTNPRNEYVDVPPSRAILLANCALLPSHLNVVLCVLQGGLTLTPASTGHAALQV